MSIDMGNPQSAERTRSPVFSVPRWAAVLTAERDGSPESAEALDHLCQAYWYPLYAYLRRRDWSPAEAERSIQTFFARFLERGFPMDRDPVASRLRTFLLVCLNSYLEERSSAPRGREPPPSGTFAPLDLAGAESRYPGPQTSLPSAETLYDREWAQATVGEALQCLEEEWRRDGRGPLFLRLRDRVLLEKPTSGLLGEVGLALGMTEGAVQVALHRLRERFGELWRAEVAATVADPGDLDAELEFLQTRLATAA